MAFRGYWDATEEQALRDAVQKHGIGAWEKMRHDVDFKVLKCVAGRTRARAPRDAALERRAFPSIHSRRRRAQARTRANADNSRFSSRARSTTDARGVFRRFFARRMRARGSARARRGDAPRRLYEHTARQRRVHPAHRFPTPDPHRHRGRTGVQLKDKWRNLIKFQHLRRGEAESAPYKGGARGAAPASAGKRKKGEDDRYASRDARATEHHAWGGRSGVARERRAAAGARGGHVNSLVRPRTAAAGETRAFSSRARSRKPFAVFEDWRRACFACFSRNAFFLFFPKLGARARDPTTRNPRDGRTRDSPRSSLVRSSASPKNAAATRPRERKKGRAPPRAGIPSVPAGRRRPPATRRAGGRARRCLPA